MLLFPEMLRGKAEVVVHELNYYEEQTERITVDFQSDTKAILTGQSKVLAAVYGGGKHWWNLQLAMTAEKRGGGWTFTYGTASTYR